MKQAIRNVVATYAIVVAVLLPLGGCAVTDLPPEVQAAIEVKDAEYDAALVRAKAALEDGDEEAYAAELVFLDQTSSDIDKLIADGAAQNAGWLTAMLSGVPVAGPFLQEVGAPALGALGMLAFDRPRKHVGKALRAINPFDGAVAPVDAFLSVLRAAGLYHSDDDTKKVFDAKVAAEKKAKAESAERKAASVG